MGPNKSTPILMCHGTADQVVTLQRGQVSYDFLKSIGTNTEFKTYQNMAHSSCDKELVDISQFFQKVIP